MEKEHESVEYITAFVIGAVIGAGATLLLRPDPPSRTERVLEHLRPVARKASSAARTAGKRYGKSLHMSRKATEELTHAGREILDNFQERVEEILSEAKDDMTEAARDKFSDASKSLKRRLRNRKFFI